MSEKGNKRRLYQSSIGKLLHADINSGLNILRKVIADGFAQNRIDGGYIFQTTSKRRVETYHIE